jgi:hypothetical protein
MKKLLSGFAFLVLFAGGLFAQNPVSKPLTHEIMVKLKKAKSNYPIPIKLFLKLAQSVRLLRVFCLPTKW